MIGIVSKPRGISRSIRWYKLMKKGLVMLSNKWYCKTWIWLAIIALTLVSLTFLFAVYLFKLKYISLINISEIFTKDGNIDFNIIWSAAGVIGSFIVAILSYKLSKRLHKLENVKYELETQPFIMLGNITIKKTAIKIIEQNGTNKFDGFEGINIPILQIKTPILFQVMSLVI